MKGRFRSATRWSVMLACVLMPGWSHSSPWEDSSGGLVLTMEETVGLALTHSPRVIQARQERERARAQISEVRADALPAVNVDLGYNRSWIQQRSTFTIEGEDRDGNPFTQTQTVTFGMPNAFQAGLSVNQVLYSGGKVKHALRAAVLYADQAETRVETAEKAVRYGVRRAFFGVLMARETIAVAEKALEHARAHLAQVQSRYREGALAEFDLIRARVEVANLEPPLIEAKNAHQQALDELIHAIGLDIGQKVLVQGDLESLVDRMMAGFAPLFEGSGDPFGNSDNLEANLDRAGAFAIQNRSDLQALEVQKALLEEQKAIARGNRRPSLMLFGTYGLQWQFADEWRARRDDINDNWSTGLALKMPIFDGGRTRSRVAQVHASRQQVETEYRKQSQRVFLDVKTALQDLDEAQKKRAAQKQTIALAERGLSIADVRFANGMSTQVEVLSAQLALTVSRTHFLQALFDCANALAALEYATGFSEQGHRVETRSSP